MVPQLKSKSDFKEFYTEYFSIMVNFAFSKTKDWELSREIAQNTFVKLWMRRDQINITTSLKSYLFMMVRNAVIDHYRQQERFTDTEIIPERASDLEENVKEENTLIIRHCIKKALEKMKPKRKMIFELSKFEGLTYAEIAEHLQISERSVEDNMAKALHAIREMLKSAKIEY